MNGESGQDGDRRGRRQVLVVDDDREVREFIAEVAAADGYDVALAENAEELERLFDHVNPDLLVLDLIMPDRDGIECLEFLATRLHGREVPILMISGADREILAIARRLGGALGLNMKDEMSKPFTVSDLEQRMERILALGAATGSATTGAVP